jgi:CheY-like chemotaxis protein
LIARLKPGENEKVNSQTETQPLRLVDTIKVAELYTLRCFTPMPARILIADDYDDNRELLRLLLQGAKYEVIEARDGQQCLDLAREHLPDLIMVDLSMPKLDGWEAFEALQADPSTKSIPCVVTTASADMDSVRARKYGFSAYVNKPFNTAALLEVVGSLLRQKLDETQLAANSSTN